MPAVSYCKVFALLYFRGKCKLIVVKWHILWWILAFFLSNLFLTFFVVVDFKTFHFYTIAYFFWVALGHFGIFHFVLNCSIFFNQVI